MLNRAGKIPKGWGMERVWFSTEDYCLKELRFAKAGNKFSFHFHKAKVESWLVIHGSFTLKVMDLKTAEVTEHTLKLNDRWTNQPSVPHQLIALEDDSVVLEVSTADHREDNFRIAPGDSQTCA